MRVFPYGNMRIETVDGAADDTEIEFRPAVGQQWLLIEVWGYHDDGTNRSLNWTYHDGVTQIIKEGSGAIAALSPWHANQKTLSTPWSTPMWPILLKHNSVGGVYMTLRADALTATKKLYIRALVYEMGDT